VALKLHCTPSFFVEMTCDLPHNRESISSRKYREVRHKSRVLS